MISQQENNIIIDRFFYQTFKRVKQYAGQNLFYYVVRALSLFAAIPVNHIVLQQKSSEAISLLTIFLIIALVYNTLEVIFLSYLYCTRFNNTSKVLKTAVDFHHTLRLHDLKDLDSQNNQDEFNLYEIQNNLNIKVSTLYYDFENMQKISEVSQQFKVLRQKNGQNIIKTALEQDLPFFKLFHGILQFLSVGIMAFGLTISSIGGTNEAQHTILQIFLISEILFKPKIFAILLIICLVPIILIIMCIYICCCKKKQPKAKLPDKVQVTPAIISKCSQCSICFQSFVAKEEVAILPCSEMHVFHYGCIEGWTKVKANCPICRALLYE